jgi:peptide/nickel transport system permease protein
MLLFLTRRVLVAIPTLAGLVFLTFFLIHIVPGDPAVILAGDQATPAQVAALREQYGFDQSIPRQFIIYLSQLAHGSFGVSYLTQRPVASEIVERLPATVELSFVAVSLAAIGGVGFGLLAAEFHNRWPDQLLRLLTIGGLAIAPFWLALMLQLKFSMDLDLLPVHGRLSTGLRLPHITGLLLLDCLLTANVAVFKDALAHIVLPATALAIGPLATIMRFTRAAVLSTLTRDFVLYERAIGYPRFVLMTKYVLRNSLITPVTQIGLLLGGILGSAVVVESIFDWPGLGSYAVTSIATADYQATLAVVLVVGVIYTFINITVDVIHAAIDPRLIQQL